MVAGLNGRSVTVSTAERRRLRFRLLGQLAAEGDDGPLALGSLKQRSVLAALLGHPNALLSTDLLTEAVWEDEPPRSARKNLQVYVSGLRGTLGGERLVHRPGGYELRVAEQELDSLRFEGLVRSGREAAARQEDAAAARLLGEALRLWEGPPLPELRHSSVLRGVAERLTGRYLAAVEDWAEVALRLGRAAQVTNTLTELAERHPLRERLQAVHLLALHRSGRRAEALAAFSALRRQLSRELGLSPGPELEACHRELLADGVAQPPARRPGRTVLPPDTTAFTGRVRESAELLGALRRADGPVVLAGPVGVGKTALAIRTAHALRAEFPDGRLLVRLRDASGRARSPQDVAADLARLLDGDRPQPAAPDPVRTPARWRDWLADRRVLVVLDGVPDERTARALLPPGGPATALVTGRTPLAGLGAAHRIDLGPFTVPEALDLLSLLVGAHRVGAAPAAAERIVTACGLLPSAVRLAGYKLAALRHLPLGEFADRLADPDRVLDELAAGDARLSDRLDAQWDALDDGQRRTLTRLSRRPWTGALDLARAADALGLAAGPALDALERLIVAGVLLCPAEEVSAHAARYTLPRLTHVHARLRAGSSPDTACTAP
ncbi:BTAD domain-containing putative transcriptional regulator [Kitasatospora sp. NPDC059646]|uniref:AfsR/SARP family transcriptional regulator n=1 Tax=Kitasatospora sp. NPDC059646 TaxID=3346893 RepID=UPI0036C227AA